MKPRTAKNIAVALSVLLLGAGGLSAQIINSGDFQINGTTSGTTTIPNLRVNGTGGMLFDSTFGQGSTPQAAATGSMFIWNPTAAAIRVGYYDSLTLANTASNYGQYSFAQGYDAVASGMGSFAAGSSAVASGMYSVAIGSNCQATNTVSMALGPGAKANGTASFAAGSNSLAAGAGSFALGSGSTSDSNFCTVVGSNNIVDPMDSVMWNPVSPIFEVGNGPVGPPPVTRSNAFVIYKNGNAVFPVPASTVSAPTFITTTPGGSGDIPMYTGN